MSLRPAWASKWELVSSGERKEERKREQGRLRDITLHPKDGCYILLVGCRLAEPMENSMDIPKQVTGGTSMTSSDSFRVTD